MIINHLENDGDDWNDKKKSGKKTFLFLVAFFMRPHNDSLTNRRQEQLSWADAISLNSIITIKKEEDNKKKYKYIRKKKLYLKLKIK